MFTLGGSYRVREFVMVALHQNRQTIHLRDAEMQH
jgi:hypothetical protein